MDWKLAMAEERAMLKRIVALFLALAELADRAARRPSPVRGFVLWVLFQAEAVARELVVGVAAPVLPGRAGNQAADAVRLARRFHDLARQLERQFAPAFAAGDDEGDQAGLARRGIRRALRTAGAPRRGNAFALPAFARNVLRLAGLPDTS
jgi:hypothetical protein